MNITFKQIPNAEDDDREIIVDDSVVGTIMKGWLRNGGNQWVIYLPNIVPFGASTLRDAKRQISRKIGD